MRLLIIKLTTLINTERRIFKSRDDNLNFRSLGWRLKVQVIYCIADRLSNAIGDNCFPSVMSELHRSRIITRTLGTHPWWVCEHPREKLSDDSWLSMVFELNSLNEVNSQIFKVHSIINSSNINLNFILK